MKPIQIPFRTLATSRLEANIETEILSTEAIEIIKKCKKRAQAILQSSMDIEEWIKDIIAQLLFDKDCTNSEFIKGLFLDSDFCMFNSKIKILNITLKHFNLLTGKKRSFIENLLPKVNKLRNQFAHGKIYLKDLSPYISYFQGELKVVKMDDEYWENIENILNEAHELMDLIQTNIPKN